METLTIVAFTCAAFAALCSLIIYVFVLQTRRFLIELLQIHSERMDAQTKRMDALSTQNGTLFELSQSLHPRLRQLYEEEKKRGRN